MTKRTFIITGGNSGPGFQCAKHIGLQNPANYSLYPAANGIGFTLNF
ncbi:MAG: hypothetical protein LBQ01_01130 [Prevotellaceae bacterium]|nr:hypothetical protein [Prevotellaceae bacterium]